jgi:hypothetical protein
MTPPTAQNGSGGKSGSAKSASKKTAKTGTKKTAPKKRTSSKKKKGGLGYKILLAFAAGLALACLGFWMLRDVSLPSLRDMVEQEAPRSVPARQKEAVQPGVWPAESSGAQLSESKEKPVLPRVEERPSQPVREGGKAANAVESALADLQGLIYEESLIQVSLEERARQVDYALMQATWLHKLPAKAMRLAAVEERDKDGERYRFQSIEILPGKDVSPFVDALKDCLALWGEGASLKPAGGDAWVIALDGIQTHSIRLYPGQTAFVQDSAIPGASIGGTSGAHLQEPHLGGFSGASAGTRKPPPGMFMPRLRSDGEEPKLAIVIDDLGGSESAVRQLLALDYPVACAFLPHGKYTRSGAKAAHAKGREVLVHQPMEPIDYPRVRPGPNALLSGMSESQIRRILDASIAAVPHAVGLNNHMGSSFSQQADGVSTVILALKERGLFMLDSRTHKDSVFSDQSRRLGIEHYSRNVFLDASPSREKILEELRRAERIALFTGQAVAIGHPLPETLAALKDWQRLRNRDVRIVKLRELRQDK